MIHETLILFGINDKCSVNCHKVPVSWHLLLSLSLTFTFAFSRSSFILAQRYIRDTRGISSFQVPAARARAPRIYMSCDRGFATLGILNPRVALTRAGLLRLLRDSMRVFTRVRDVG